MKTTIKNFFKKEYEIEPGDKNHFVRILHSLESKTLSIKSSYNLKFLPYIFMTFGGSAVALSAFLFVNTLIVENKSIIYTQPPSHKLEMSAQIMTENTYKQSSICYVKDQLSFSGRLYCEIKNLFSTEEE